MSRIRPINDHIYHIYNRGVDKRDIFMDDEDRFRFIHDLYEFNDKKPAPNLYYKSPELKSYEVGLRKIQPRECLVDILSFCMMNNHLHLILRQVSDNGISEFMQKLGSGYTNYFNNKYERSGSLFQGKYKLKLVENEAQYVYLPHYIHLNPLKLVFPKWKENGVGDVKKAKRFLEEYRWSSYRDYIGKKNFPSIISQKFVSELYGGPQNYRNSIEIWLEDLPKNLTKSDFVRL